MNFELIDQMAEELRPVDGNIYDELKEVCDLVEELSQCEETLSATENMSDDAIQAAYEGILDKVKGSLSSVVTSINTFITRTMKKLRDDYMSFLVDGATAVKDWEKRLSSLAPDEEAFKSATPSRAMFDKKVHTQHYKNFMAIFKLASGYEKDIASSNQSTVTPNMQKVIATFKKSDIIITRSLSSLSSHYFQVTQPYTKAYSTATFGDKGWSSKDAKPALDEIKKHVKDGQRFEAWKLVDKIYSDYQSMVPLLRKARTSSYNEGGKTKADVEVNDLLRKVTRLFFYYTALHAAWDLLCMPCLFGDITILRGLDIASTGNNAE